MVVNRKEFSFPAAGEDEDNFEIAKGIWSKDWMGLYCKAELPPQHFQDLKCMAIEKNHGWCTNPRQLLRCIPELVPIATKALQPRKEEGAYTLTEEADKVMREANWDELFNMKTRLIEEEKANAQSGSGAAP